MIRSELPSILTNINALSSMQAEMDGYAENINEDHPEIDHPASNVVSLISRLIEETNDPIVMITPAETVAVIEEDMTAEWDEIVVTGEFVFNPSMKAQHALTMSEAQDKMDDIEAIMATLGCEVSFHEIKSVIFADDDDIYG